MLGACHSPCQSEVCHGMHGWHISTGLPQVSTGCPLCAKPRKQSCPACCSCQMVQKLKHHQTPCTSSASRTNPAHDSCCHVSCKGVMCALGSALRSHLAALPCSQQAKLDHLELLSSCGRVGMCRLLACLHHRLLSCCCWWWGWRMCVC